jgi:hypothetical protein
MSMDFEEIDSREAAKTVLAVIFVIVCLIGCGVLVVAVVR